MTETTSTAAEQGHIIGCNHLGINVDNLTSAKHFYGEILALKELQRPEAVAKMFSSAWYLLGNAELHVVEDPKMVQNSSPAGPHFAISTSNFKAITTRLAKTDIDIVFGPGAGLDGIDRLVIKDPAGNVIELIDLPLR